MKHAYLIIAHNDYKLLDTLLDRLDDARNDIFLHIDKRSFILFSKIKNKILKHASLYIIENRISVHWGDISQVKVEYKLFEYAHSKGPYLYYHLLSGTDLPIKSMDYINEFFIEHQGTEFVSIWNDKAHLRDLNRKIGRHYLFTSKFKEGNLITHSLTSAIRNIVLALQKASKYRRNKDIEFRKGSNWVSITEDFCTFVLDNKEWVMKHFKRTLCPDEIFIQTLIINSPFKDKIYQSEEPNDLALRKIDWHRGSPYIWKKEDEDELNKSSCLFCRKFNSKYFIYKS